MGISVSRMKVELAFGLLANNLRFVVPNRNESNKSRWKTPITVSFFPGSAMKTTPWLQKFSENASRIDESFRVYGDIFGREREHLLERGAKAVRRVTLFLTAPSNVPNAA